MASGRIDIAGEDAYTFEQFRRQERFGQEEASRHTEGLERLFGGLSADVDDGKLRVQNAREAGDIVSCRSGSEVHIHDHAAETLPGAQRFVSLPIRRDTARLDPGVLQSVGQQTADSVVILNDEHASLDGRMADGVGQSGSPLNSLIQRAPTRLGRRHIAKGGNFQMISSSMNSGRTRAFGMALRIARSAPVGDAFKVILWVRSEGFAMELFDLGAVRSCH